jgi:hypothetical protein
MFLDKIMRFILMVGAISSFCIYYRSGHNIDYILGIFCVGAREFIKWRG